MASDDTPESSSSQDLKRALFKSPSNQEGDGEDKAFNNIVGKLMRDVDVGVNPGFIKIMQKDEHNQRMKDLRGLLKEISDDNWRYENIEKLTGICENK